MATLSRLCSAVLLLLALLLSGTCSAANGSPPTASERDIKAVYLYNFIRFTEWPDDIPFSDSIRPTLVIMGDLDLLRVFRSDAFARASSDFRMDTLSCDTPLCAGKGNALFIDRSMQPDLKKILRSLDGKAVLTVSDIPGFAEQGGMVELRQRQGRVDFRINLQAARQAGLYISAQLLQLAEIVGETP